MMIFQFQNNPIKGQFLAIFRILKSLTQKKISFNASDILQSLRLLRFMQCAGNSEG